ncbi:MULTISPECIES: hypothetical protein [unclassified Synechocystis]|uniref:hypothetical protein n=1 Tax=unclassified Synechocystis TaxID=2640012 RepID=UPI00057089D3|nr:MULTISPECIES: hypothetical protein [unclassified Synechocystis]MCT0253449.1 hypothetical protein [Synechocystis sp. CS-94]
MIEALLVPVSKIADADQLAMFQLLQTHFEGVFWPQFQGDLNSKDWVILLKLAGVLKGFTTFCFYPIHWQGETLRIVYSGDTITDPSIWSNPALAKAWTKAMQTLHGQRPEKLYWLLISSGYRTYRFLSIFAKEFYPHYRCPTPPSVQNFIDYLAQEKFQEHYDSSLGIVRLPQPQVLTPNLLRVPEEKLGDRHVEFFLQKNPGHVEGDELVCLAEVSAENLTKAGLRIWHSSYAVNILD